MARNIITSFGKRALASGARLAVIAVMLFPAAGISLLMPLKAEITFLEQGWEKDLRERFYFTPQGSRMIPYAWFTALETPDGSGMFADDAHLKTYGLIPADEAHPQLNPDALPIGFAIDPFDDPATGKSLGLTCAACHTSEITVEGKHVRIDGGASNFDFDRFYGDLAAAISRTFFDPEAFKRFAGRILAKQAADAKQSPDDMRYVTDGNELSELAANAGRAGLLDEAIARFRQHLSDVQKELENSGEADNLAFFEKGERMIREAAAKLREEYKNVSPKAKDKGAPASGESPEEAAKRMAAEKLRFHLARFESKIAGEAVMRRPALASGPGRVDALTQILNAVSVTAQSEPYNLRANKAPVSYPHLWLTPHLEYVQWSPIVSNPIARNGGEALGVFASATLHGADKERYFASTILPRELHALESWVKDLQPPAWDENIFGAVNPGLAAQGEKLYAKNCASCHSTEPYPRSDPAENKFGKTFIKIVPVNFREVGTDPVYIESLAGRIMRTNPVTASVLEGADIASAPDYFKNVSRGIVKRAMDDAGLSLQEQIVFSDFRIRPDGSTYAPPCTTVPCMKAGPLAGIWASGPYLHNGSVPTIYELLSPQEERRKVFWTGGRELDREKLGFLSGDAPGRFRFDTSVAGNGNQGHLYPKEGLSPDERAALVEYLKTL